MSPSEQPAAAPLSDPADIDSLAQFARRDGARVAIHIDSEAPPLTYAELDRRAAQVAHWFVAQGLQPEDGVAFLLENRLDYFSLSWGARRAGLYYTPISIHLQASEIGYVLADSGAKLLITSPQWSEAARAIAQQSDWRGPCFVVDGQAPGLISLAPQLEAFDANAPLPQRPVGRDFLYSSGTSGKPKGVKRALTPYAQRLEPTFESAFFSQHYGIGPDCIYLSPAPLYHAAPHRFTMRCVEFGATAVVMPHFDAERALALTEQYRCTHSQWVPTMMVRMLALPQAVKNRYDLSSMHTFIHAAAPCPPDVKRGIIAWWGPVVVEYYGGSESVGITLLHTDEWLAHPGSVGKAVLGVIHIKDDHGNDLPAGEQGMIYFTGTPPFSYHNDPAKTAQAYASDGAATYGDIGHVDADGYLYLSGRRTDLIITGGVNVYPQEVENLLASYPGVADVAVIGVPHPEYGQAVKAVVELLPGAQGDDAMAQAIVAFCRTHLAHIKCPRSVDFIPRLPRQANGKLYKRHLMAEYERRAQA
jgi:long-chain acyl-CoA synthetase